MDEITTKMLENGVVKVTFDDPQRPVNTMTPDLLTEFEKKIVPLMTDEAVEGMVFCSAKPETFIAGADIKLFAEADDPDLVCELDGAYSRILTRLSRGEKPVVAAVHGAALGGGLEIVLACHYIVASDHPATVLGLPEVQLGILPAAGGTQRLPDRVGLVKGLDMMLTGRRVRARRALRLGLVDEVTPPGAVFQKALERAVDLIEGRLKRPQRRKSLVERVIELPVARDIFFGKVRKQILAKTRGNYPGPLKIVECVELGVKEGMDPALEQEISHIGPLLMTPQSRSLVWLFLAGQEMKAIPLESSRAVKQVGILGAGSMGTGIASVSLNQYFVVVHDRSRETLEGCREQIRAGLTKQVKSEAITPQTLEKRLTRLRTTHDMGDMAAANLVIEAVSVDLHLKQKVLAEVEERVGTETVIAVNTSFMPISRIAAYARYKERVVGLQYFAPVHKMPLVELIAPEGVATWALHTAHDFTLKQGKTVIQVKDRPGFYTTRILCRYLQEALMLVSEGNDIERIDAAMKNFGYASGPMALMDEMGLDAVNRAARFMCDAMGERWPKPLKALGLLVDAGFSGRKGEIGFYTYAKGKRGKKKPNRDVYPYVNGMKQDILDPRNIRERLVLAMVNEAAFCLEEAVIASPEDGDVGAVLGLGFPPFLGGPFHYADSLGTGLVKGLEELVNLGHTHYAPAGILRDMAKRGTRFFS
jgi:3-hydroxyacyl-CoA dehydrogenase / enoyl-CoA hydratase / 3-hydroxybutyryl-CoA epimerase